MSNFVVFFSRHFVTESCFGFHFIRCSQWQVYWSGLVDGNALYLFYLQY